MKKGTIPLHRHSLDFRYLRDYPQNSKQKCTILILLKILPDIFKNFGHTEKTQYGAIQLSQNGEDFPIFGLQLHPEKSFRKINRTIFTNFYEMCLQKIAYIKLILSFLSFY